MKKRKAVHEDLDVAFVIWFKQQRTLNTPIGGPILKVEADQMTRNLGVEDFEWLTGWLDRFKKHHDIVFGKICGEVADVNKEVTENWLKEEWPKVRKGFQDDDVFNGDETGLFLKWVLLKILNLKIRNTLEGSYLNRDWQFLCVNLSCTEKKELLVIGKSKKPRCFKNINKLPVKYMENKKAWIMGGIFETEVRKWDNELARNHHKIILLLDNCTAHPRLEGLSAIKLRFIPANTTSVLQPMDQGVIRSLKVQYRLVHNCTLLSVKIHHYLWNLIFYVRKRMILRLLETTNN